MLATGLLVVIFPQLVCEGSVCFKCTLVHVHVFSFIQLHAQYERNFPEDEDGGHLIDLGSEDSEAQINSLFCGESGTYLQFIYTRVCVSVQYHPSYM